MTQEKLLIKILNDLKLAEAHLVHVASIHNSIIKNIEILFNGANKIKITKDLSDENKALLIAKFRKSLFRKPKSM